MIFAKKADDAPRYEDCYFYHCWDLPEGGFVPGHFDLRGREDRYTGFVNLGGKKVLEIGPASGGLTIYMERQGADVLCFETAKDVSVDVLPKYGSNIEENIQAGKNITEAVTKSWDYMRRKLGLRAHPRSFDSC